MPACMTCVTCTLLAAGIPVHVVAARLGHADPAVTLRVYSHVLREHSVSVGDVFAQAMKATVLPRQSRTTRPTHERGPSLFVPWGLAAVVRDSAANLPEPVTPKY